MPLKQDERIDKLLSIIRNKRLLSAQTFVAQFSIDYGVSPETVWKYLGVLRDAGLIGILFKDVVSVPGLPQQFL